MFLLKFLSSSNWANIIKQHIMLARETWKGEIKLFHASSLKTDKCDLQMEHYVFWNFTGVSALN